MNREFEQRITVGRAQWVISCRYDASKSSLTLGLTPDTSQLKPKRVIEFSGIQNMASRWLKHDQGSIEGLLGAHEDNSNDQYRYLLVTDQREIELTTLHQASIKDV